MTQELRVESPTPELPDTQHYDSLAVALDAYGVTTKYASIQMPEGYVFRDARVAEVANAIKVLAVYTCGESEIAFTIWHYRDSTSLELQVAEKLPTDAECYIRNGVKHYVMENSTMATATWIIGTEMYLLAGSVTSSEMIQMIDSIYEG